MRYERLVAGLERARTKYEATVRALVAAAYKQDAGAEDAIRKLVKKSSKPHWTQLPKNRKRVLAHLKRIKAK